MNEKVETGRLGVPFGNLREHESLKALATDLDVCGVFEWWNRHMGFSKQEEDESN